MTNLRSKRFQRDIHGVKIESLGVQNGFSLLNLGLSVLIAGLLVWYAFGGNHLGLSSYRENILKTSLFKLIEENSLLLAEKSAGADLSSLFTFVEKAGLVEQKSIEYIFDEKGLAQAQESFAR